MPTPQQEAQFHVQFTGFPKRDARVVDENGLWGIPWYQLLVEMWRRLGGSSNAADNASFLQGGTVFDSSTGAEIGSAQIAGQPVVITGAPVGAVVFIGTGSALAFDIASLAWDDAAKVLTISGNTSVGTVTGTVLHVVGNNTGDASTLQDAFNGVAEFIGRRANGTAAAPTNVLTGQVIAGIGARGYGASAYSGSDVGEVRVAAAQNFTNAAQGTRVEVVTTPLGSTSEAVAATFGPDKTLKVEAGVTVGSAVLLTTSVTLTDATGAAAGTLTNAPTAGDPSKWIEINDNGTIRKIPTWL